MTNKLESETADKNTIYEVGFLLISTIPEENVPAEVTAIKDSLEKLRAQILSEETPKIRQLAYKMKKKIGTVNQIFDMAYFGWIKFEAKPETAIEIKKSFNSNQSVLRFLLITTVRENTLANAKVLKDSSRAAKIGEEVQVVEKTKPKMSEAEIDKTIEELVVE